MNVLVFSFITILIFKYSKWHIIALIIPLEFLTLGLMPIVNVNKYGAGLSLNEYGFIYDFGAWSFFSSMFLMIIYGIYLFVKKDKNRFYHLFAISINIIWLFIAFLYEGTLQVAISFTSFPENNIGWSYSVVKNEIFWKYTILYIFVMGLTIISYQILKTKIRHKVQKRPQI